MRESVEPHVNFFHFILLADALVAEFLKGFLVAPPGGVAKEDQASQVFWARCFISHGIDKDLTLTRVLLIAEI